ncbi:hypothetical protein BH24ACI1_BH24ACI1_18790 [soil metagenome]
MKYICTIFLSLVIALAISSPIFAQSTVDKIFGVPVNELYRGNIELPSDITITAAKFFNIVTESLHNTTVNLFDENQALLWKVVIVENTSTKTVEYKIFDSNSNLQWVKVVRTVENGKDIANATSSSGKTMKITTSRGNITSGCEMRVPVAEIEIIVNNELPKTISSAEMKTQKGKSNLPGFIQQAEEKFFNTEQLRILQSVVFSLDDLQSIVMERSTMEEEEESRSPNCDVFCVRTGIVLPIYYCNSVTLNCSRCGVNGAFVIGGFGCFWLCAIACSAFQIQA